MRHHYNKDILLLGMAVNRDSINTTVFEEKGRAALAGLGRGRNFLQKLSPPSPTLYSFFPFSLDKLLLQRLRVKVKELAEQIQGAAQKDGVPVRIFGGNEGGRFFQGEAQALGRLRDGWPAPFGSCGS